MNKSQSQVDRHLQFCIMSEFVQGTIHIFKGALLVSGFSASMYGDPEESRDIAVSDMTEMMDATRWWAS